MFRLIGKVSPLLSVLFFFFIITPTFLPVKANINSGQVSSIKIVGDKILIGKIDNLPGSDASEGVLNVSWLQDDTITELESVVLPRCLPNQEVSITGIDFDGEYIYVAGGQCGLYIYKANDFRNLRLITRYETFGSAMKVVVDSHRDLAFVANGNDGLRIFDVSNPRRIKRLGGVLTPGGFAYSLELGVDGYIYVLDNLEGQGMFTIDVNNVDNPIIISNNPGYSYGIKLLGNYLYRADYIRGMTIFDVSNPSLPNQLSVLNNPPSSNLNIDVYDGYAVIADGVNGVVLVDVHNPVSPFLLKRLELPNNAMALDVAIHSSSRLAILGTSSMGIISFKLPQD